MSIAFLIIGLFAGAAAVYLWARGAMRAAEARADAERRAADEKLALLARTEDEWSERIKAVTGEALTTSQRSLLDLTDAKLKPIKETLDKFEKQAKALEDQRLREVTAVGQQLKDVVAGQEKLRTETGNLVTALRAPHVRGRWGEVQLKRVVELAGMVEYCDFRMQQSERDDDGRLLRPDMVVKLPGGKSVVVDAKTPFEAYLDALNADDVDVKRRHLTRHATQVRDHVTKLGQKRYWQQFNPSPEFVVMFVDEGLYRSALDEDPSLFEHGVEAGVMIASPSTLMPLLRTVAYAWQQETVAESARETAKLGRELYDRLGVFASHFAKVGKGLESAVKTYNDAASSLERRLLVTGRKFQELGVSGDELPEAKQIEHMPVTSGDLVALPTAESDAA
jgi:DNA recombination protein RmuC